MSDFITPPKHANFRAKKLFGAVGNIADGEAKILLGDEEVIIHQDEAFLVEGRIPHSCWNNIDGLTKMIGITVI